jgi:MoxR-like ATPase
MYVDEKMVEFAEALCTATRNDPHVRTGLGPEHAAKLIEEAKLVATAQKRSYVTPVDIKTAFPTYAQGKVFLADATTTLAAVISHALDYTEVP